MHGQPFSQSGPSGSDSAEQSRASASQADDRSDDATHGGGPAALGRLEKQWEELIEYIGYYLAAHRCGEIVAVAQR